MQNDDFVASLALELWDAWQSVPGQNCLCLWQELCCHGPDKATVTEWRNPAQGTQRSPGLGLGQLWQREETPL